MSDGFRGRLFGPDIAGAGNQVWAEWRGQELCVHLGEAILIASSPKAEPAGFNREHVRLTWPTERGIYALLVQSEPERLKLLAGAPEPLRRPIDASARARERLARNQRLWIWGSLVAVVLVVSAVIAGILSASGWSAALARWIPPEQEAQLGELVLAETRSRMEVVDRGEAVDALRAIGKRLVPESRFEYRWYVAKSSDLNAFAAPGGFVVATTGILQAADSAEELAGVLAHEIAHVELRHGTAALIKSLGLRAAAAILLGGGDWAGAAVELTSLKFSRDAEMQADDEGLRRMRAAAIAPEGMLRMFEKLSREQVAHGLTLPEFLSTHPDTRERIERIRKLIAQAPAYQATPLPIDWARVKADLPR